MKAMKWSVMSLILLVGCAQRDYITNAPAIVKAADWSETQSISVYLSEFTFSLNQITLQAGVPYKMQIKNNGTVKHYFTAEEFFRAIATRKVQSNSDGEIKAPYFTAIEVFPGRSLDLYFIPVKKGIYGLKCIIAGHAEKGMVGQIVIR